MPGTGTTLTPTHCRICEPLCPLVAETDGNGTVVAIHPDRDHPVSGGFACHKGTSFGAVHHDPNRLDHPLRRANPKSDPIGRFEEVTWDEAFADIGERLREIRLRHGTEAVGCYWGNPLAYTSPGIPTVYSFWGKMQSTRLFGGLTQDLSNKFAAMDAIFGVEAMFPAPDLFHTDYFLCLGSDPSGSHLTAVSVPNAIEAIRGIRARGGDVTFVNPRRIRAVEMGLGGHLQIKPDTDAYFLAAMLTEMDHLGAWDEDGLARHGRNVGELREFIAPFDADSVAGVTGLSPDDIRRTAPRLRRRAHCHRAHGHRRQHGSPGNARLLAAADGQPGHRQPWSRGRRAAARTAHRRDVRRAARPVLRFSRRSGATHLGPRTGQPHGRVRPRRPGSAARADRHRRQPDHGRARRGAAPRGIPRARARGDHGPVPQRDRRALRLRAPGERLAGAGRLPGWRCRDRADCAVRRRGRGAGRRPRRGMVDPGPHRTGARLAVHTRRRHRLRGRGQRGDGERGGNEHRRAPHAPVEHQGPRAVPLAVDRGGGGVHRRARRLLSAVVRARARPRERSSPSSKASRRRRSSSSSGATADSTTPGDDG